MQQWYCYIRVSTEEQKDGFSPEAQLQAMQKQAELSGATIVKIYDGDLGLSAKDDKRPALKQMLADLKRLPKHKRPQAIIVDHTDRLSRNLRIFLNIVHELQQLEVKLWTSKGIVDLQSDSGIMTMQFEGIMNEQYLRNLSYKTSQGLREKARQGFWVGLPPYGYIKADKDRITPHDPAADAVRMIFALYQTEAYSIAQLADYMNNHAHIYHRTFGLESLRDILQNRAYCGYTASGGEEFKGQHEPLISEEQWRICEQIRQARTRHRTARHRGQSSTVLLVGGLGRCHVCGQVMWASNSGRIGLNQKHIPYYRCSGSSRRNCDTKQSNAARIDQQVLDLVCQIGLAVEYHQQAIDQLLSMVPEQPVQRIDPVKIQAKMDRLSVAWVQGNISDQAYQQQLAALKEQLTLPEEQPQTMLDLVQARRMLASLPDVIQAATLPERRALINMMFESVDIGDKRIQGIQPKKMYAVLLAAARHQEQIHVSRWSGKRAFSPTSTSIDWCSVPLLAGYRQPLVMPVFQ